MRFSGNSTSMGTYGEDREIRAMQYLYRREIHVYNNDGEIQKIYSEISKQGFWKDGIKLLFVFVE